MLLQPIERLILLVIGMTENNEELFSYWCYLFIAVSTNIEYYSELHEIIPSQGHMVSQLPLVTSVSQALRVVYDPLIPLVYRVRLISFAVIMSDIEAQRPMRSMLPDGSNDGTLLPNQHDEWTLETQ